MSPERRMKIAVVALVAIAAILVAVIVWQRSKIAAQQRALVEAAQAGSSVRLSDGTTRTPAVETAAGGAAAVAEQVGADLDQVRKDAAVLGATLNAVVAGVVRTSGKRAEGVSSSATEPRDAVAAPSPTQAPPGEDKWGYTRAKQKLRLTEPFADGQQVPFGEASFSAWEKSPWGTDVFPRSYKLIATGSIDDAGNKRIYTQFFVEVDGKKYKLPVSEAVYAEDSPPHRFRWRLKPLVGISVAPFVRGEDGIAVMPSLQLALAGYGRLAELPEWQFFSLGVGYDPRLADWALLLVPAAYNVGKPLPLFDNLYLGPSVGIEAHGGISVGGALQVGL